LRIFVTLSFAEKDRPQFTVEQQRFGSLFERRVGVGAAGADIAAAGAVGVGAERRAGAAAAVLRSLLVDD